MKVLKSDLLKVITILIISFSVIFTLDYSLPTPIRYFCFIIVIIFILIILIAMIYNFIKLIKSDWQKVKEGENVK